MEDMEDFLAAYKKRLGDLQRSNSPFATGIAWVSGEFVPLLEAKIPLIDEGFMRSDMTYDVGAVWHGHFFRLDDHIARLEASCSKLRLQLPLPRDDVKNLLVDMVRRSGIRDALVKIMVSRGLLSLWEKRPQDLTNALYMTVVPYKWLVQPEAQVIGGTAVIARTVRRVPPEAMDPTVKNLQWGDFVRGMLESSDRGAAFPFLTDGDDNLTEGSGFNIMLVKDGIISTPDRCCLLGITRRCVFEIAEAIGVEARAETVPAKMAYECDEIFISSTAGGIMPITTLDGQPVNDGKPGPVTKMVWDWYWKMHKDPAHTHAILYD